MSYFSRLAIGGQKTRLQAAGAGFEQANPRMGLLAARSAVRKGRLDSVSASQPLHDVVIDHHHRKQHEEDECDLIEAFLDSQADIFLRQGFDEQQENYTAVKDRNRQQVENPQIEADGSGDSEQRYPAFLSHSSPDG